MLLQNQITSLLFRCLAPTEKLDQTYKSVLKGTVQVLVLLVGRLPLSSGGAQSKARWKLGWIQPSNEILLQAGCRNIGFILEFFLENARGFQGIYDILLYSCFQGVRSLYSRRSAPTCKSLLTNWGILFPEVFIALIKARVQRMLVIWEQGLELLLGAS